MSNRPALFLIVSLEFTGERRRRFAFPLPLFSALLFLDALDDFYLILNGVTFGRFSAGKGKVAQAAQWIPTAGRLLTGLMHSGPDDLADIETGRVRFRLRFK